MRWLHAEQRSGAITFAEDTVRGHVVDVLDHATWAQVSIIVCGDAAASASYARLIGAAPSFKIDIDADDEWRLGRKALPWMMPPSRRQAVTVTWPEGFQMASVDPVGTWILVADGLTEQQRRDLALQPWDPALMISANPA